MVHMLFYAVCFNTLRYHLEVQPFFHLSKYFWTHSGVENSGHGSFLTSMDWCQLFRRPATLLRRCSIEALNSTAENATYCHPGYTSVLCMCHCTLHGPWHSDDHIFAICLNARTGVLIQLEDECYTAGLPTYRTPSCAGIKDKLARPMARSGSFQAAERGRRLDRRIASRMCVSSEVRPAGSLECTCCTR